MDTMEQAKKNLMDAIDRFIEHSFRFNSADKMLCVAVIKGGEEDAMRACAHRGITVVRTHWTGKDSVGNQKTTFIVKSDSNTMNAWFCETHAQAPLDFESGTLLWWRPGEQ